MRANERFLAVPLATLRADTLAPVDLYLHTGPDSFVLYRAASTPLSVGTIDRLAEFGVDRLYVRGEDEASYYEYVERNLKTIVRDKHLPRQELSKVVYDVSVRVMKDVFEDPRSGANLKRSIRVMDAIVQAIMQDPATVWDVTAVASHDYYTYTHCVHVGVFLVATSKDLLGIENPTTLRAIGHGGIYHDVGKTAIAKSILMKPGKLTEEEFERIKEHPLLGLDVVRRHGKLPKLAVQVIRSHHERLDGTGYPDGLSGTRISKFMRLAAISDVYDALTTNRAYAVAMKPFDALSLMLAKMDGHLDQDLLRAFVKFLGPRDARQVSETPAISSQSA